MESVDGRFTYQHPFALPLPLRLPPLPSPHPASRPVRRRLTRGKQQSIRESRLGVHGSPIRPTSSHQMFGPLNQTCIAFHSHVGRPSAFQFPSLEPILDGYRLLWKNGIQLVASLHDSLKPSTQKTMLSPNGRRAVETRSPERERSASRGTAIDPQFCFR